MALLLRKIQLRCRSSNATWDPHNFSQNAYAQLFVWVEHTNFHVLKMKMQMKYSKLSLVQK